MRACRKSVGRVGLFVDPDDALLDERLATGAIDMLQLQGGGDARKGRRHKGTHRQAGDEGDQRRRGGRRRARHRRLCERRRPADVRCGAEGILPGGNARAFDWTILSGRSVPLPWFLAGGLTPDNVAEAVRVTGARTVDVSSGVESSRGVKSIDLIRAFLDRVKAL